MPDLGSEIWHHYTFDPPQRELTAVEKKTNNYTRKVLHGVGVYDVIPGALPYEESRRIITSLGDYKIVCAGNVAAAWLKSILPYGDITDIQTLTPFTYPKDMPEITCGVNHCPRYCSKEKLWTLVFYFKYCRLDSLWQFYN